MPTRARHRSHRVVEIGRLLRLHRERLQPADLGFSRVGRSHARGLRREEVARAAGVSTAWYTRLEQGIAERPSRDVLEALARTLCMDDMSRSYVLWLGGYVSPGPGQGSPGPFLAHVRSLHPAPAFVMTPAHDLIAWNAPYAALFGDPAALLPAHRNALYAFLTSPMVQEQVEGWEQQARSMIANYRLHRAHPAVDGEPGRYDAVVEECLAASALFREIWPLHELHRHGDLTEIYDHPTVGAITMNVLKMRPIGLSEYVYVVVRQPADDLSAARLARAVAESERMAAHSFAAAGASARFT